MYLARCLATNRCAGSVIEGLLTNSLVARLKNQGRLTDSLPMEMQLQCRQRDQITLTQAELRLMQAALGNGRIDRGRSCGRDFRQRGACLHLRPDDHSDSRDQGLRQPPAGGRAFIYSACVGESEASRSELPRIATVLQQLPGAALALCSWLMTRSAPASYAG